jgi:hypothetical protein
MVASNDFVDLIYHNRQTKSATLSDFFSTLLVWEPDSNSGGQVVQYTELICLFSLFLFKTLLKVLLLLTGYFLLNTPHNTASCCIAFNTGIVSVFFPSPLDLGICPFGG